jgi:hypothetical protein
MARLGGNPDFGTKYRFDYGRNEPFSEKVLVLMYTRMKSQLNSLAKERNCSVPDVIRVAIEQYLESLPDEERECSVRGTSSDS